MRLHPASLLALAMLAACGNDGPVAPTDPDPLVVRPIGDPFEVSFDFRVRGEHEVTASGASRATMFDPGYREIDPRGNRTDSPVLVVNLGAQPPIGIPMAPQISLGIIGAEVRTGTYVVRKPGATPLGARPEFYASFIQPLGGARVANYVAGEGTITVTSVSPRIEGTFAFRAAYTYESSWYDRTGTSYATRAAALEASGRFSVAR